MRESFARVSYRSKIVYWSRTNGENYIHARERPRVRVAPFLDQQNTEGAEVEVHGFVQEIRSTVEIRAYFVF